MAAYRPLVLVSGVINQLPPGEGVIGGELIAGSGLSGGGVVQPNARLDIDLAPNPSGLIFVGETLGLDGKALASGQAALNLANLAYQTALNANFPTTEGSAGFLDNVDSFSTVGVQLDTFASTSYSAVAYSIRAKRGSEVHSTEIKLVHNNSTVYQTEYGVVYTSGALAAYSGILTGGQLELNAYPNSAASTQYRIVRFAQAW